MTQPNASNIAYLGKVLRPYNQHWNEDYTIKDMHGYVYFSNS